MLNKLMLLAIIFALVLSLGFVIACGDDDDDDDDATDDDDDDDADDDDTGETCDYVQELTWLVTGCGMEFVDTEGNDMTLQDIIEDCSKGLGECGWAYMDIPDCDGAEDCIIADCF